MDPKYCSCYIRKLPITSFLQNASAAPGSKVFATCFPCRERTGLLAKKRKASRQLGPETTVDPPVTIDPTNLLTTEAAFPVQIPIRAPLQPLPAPAIPPPPESIPRPAIPPPEGFLPAEQWQWIQDFNEKMGCIQMETCFRCKERWFLLDLKQGVCHTCFLRDKRNHSPFLMSIENHMDPGELPAYLPALSQVEEIIIARSHMQMLIYRYRGH